VPLQSTSTIYEIVGFRSGAVKVYVFAENVPSSNIVRAIESRRMRWAGHVVCMGEWRGADRVLVGTPEGKRPLTRPGRRWEDNIKMYIQEVG
jgi:hypothetical protein